MSISKRTSVTFAFENKSKIVFLILAVEQTSLALADAKARLSIYHLFFFTVIGGPADFFLLLLGS